MYKMRNLKKLLLFLFLVLATLSCVPYKDTLYLEKNKEKTSSIEVNVDAFKPYRIQTGDILSINIKALDQKLVDIFNKESSNGSQQSSFSADMLYLNGYKVNDFGNIQIPILGEVPVLNLTVDEISDKIKNLLLTEYLTVQSNLFVNVKMAGIKYTTNGEIASKGTKTIFQDKITILEAIANSGDILETGNKKDVIIMRKVNSGFETYSLDLTDANVINDPNFFIKPNDYIYIKPLRNKSWGIGNNGIQTFTTLISVFGVLTSTYLILKSL